MDNSIGEESRHSQPDYNLLLLLDVEGATQLGEGDDGAIRPLLRCHELVLPAEKLDFALAWRPCTSLSALQAK
jgi:hypothetical protein